jgi:hypothetical protein
MTSKNFGTQVKLKWELVHTNVIGETSLAAAGTKVIEYHPYINKELEALPVPMQSKAGLSILTLKLEDEKGTVLHHNFMHFEIQSDSKLPNTEIFSVAPASFTQGSWSKKQWNVLDGMKVNGAGDGKFEYTIKLDRSLNLNAVKEIFFLIEISAKELFVKDLDKKERVDVDYMLGGKASPSANPNSYPMTDETLFPSKVSILIDGTPALTTTLPDDPADHRGVLSWHHQLQDRKLREAGSYGYLTKVPVSKQQLKAAIEKGEMKIQLKTIGEGGIAVYGKSFGRYPIDPSLVIRMK